MTETILTVTARNRPGSLARVASLFLRRGINLRFAGVTPAGDLARMTFAAETDLETGKALARQIQRLVDVRGATADPGCSSLRVLAIYEVDVTGPERRRAVEMAAIFRGRAIDADERQLTLEASGLPEEMDALEELLSEVGPVRALRSSPLPYARAS